MNWKQIAVFVGILFLATVAASLPFGFVQGFLAAQQRPVPRWVPLGQMMAVPAAAAGVFYLLARRQADRPWGHALAVATLAWLLSFPLNVVALGQSPVEWALGIIVGLVALGVGVGVASIQYCGRRR
jgi:hypothetical protein